MGYDHGDSFPFDFEPNRIPFGSNRKEICHHDHIPFNVKEIGSKVFSVQLSCIHLGVCRWKNNRLVDVGCTQRNLFEILLNQP